jgi:magnesium-transporting ATPase (P-type)
MVMILREGVFKELRSDDIVVGDIVLSREGEVINNKCE